MPHEHAQSPDVVPRSRPIVAGAMLRTRTAGWLASGSTPHLEADPALPLLSLRGVLLDAMNSTHVRRVRVSLKSADSARGAPK